MVSTPAPSRSDATRRSLRMRSVFFLTVFCTFSTGFNLFGGRRGACRTVTMSSTPNQYDESKWAPQRLSAALQHLRAYTLDQAAGTMQRQLSSWTQALQRFRIEPSSTDEEVHSAPATWDEPDATLPDPRREEDIREMRLAASVLRSQKLRCARPNSAAIMMNSSRAFSNFIQQLKHATGWSSRRVGCRSRASFGLPSS